MATGTIKNTLSSRIDNMFQTRTAERNHSYIASTTYDDVVLIIGKYGADAILDVAIKNGGSPNITHFGTATGITVSNTDNKFTINMPQFYDGRIFCCSLNKTTYSEI